MAAAPVEVTGVPGDPAQRGGGDRGANPYANYGSPVSSQEFVGRTDHVRSIRNRMFTSPEAAPVSIIGPPRVGKSSLAKLVLERFAVGRSERGLTYVPLWLTVGGSDSEQSLFRELACEIQVWISDQGDDADRLQSRYDMIAGSISWDDMRRHLIVYLKQVRRCGYQVVAVLDEFDAARNVFHRSAPFELLRAIAYGTDLRVALITTSRRSLSDIVVKSTAELSTFPQIFGLPVTLGCFDGPELAALIGRSPYAHEELRAALFAWLTRETGGQPFLASALLSVLHERWISEGAPSSGDLERHFGDAIAACGQLTVDHHERMLELLREEKRLTKLLEVLFGPQVTVGPLDAERLAREGIIKMTQDGWSAFSESFQQYLGLLERSSDDWQLWQETETRLRSALAASLELAYGEIWPIRLAESQGRLVGDCQARREHARRAYGELAPDDNLLEYAYPHDLLSIMMLHWDQLAPTFGHHKDDWRKRIELVAKARTPMAHNRSAGTSPLLMEQFRAACQEILNWLPASAGRSR